MVHVDLLLTTTGHGGDDSKTLNHYLIVQKAALQETEAGSHIRGHGHRVIRIFLRVWSEHGLPMIVTIRFLHGCSTPSGPDDSGDANDELRAVSINRHAEFRHLFPLLHFRILRTKVVGSSEMI